ncbi:unnamed protein product [Urochloa decumbens]|uniref:protein-serine/threonine phosphatase n=1 Tax=Urochloa decumbens TaxID=240449 RepID=A0ABC9DBE8_9POAL
MVMASAGTNRPGGGDGSPASAPFSSAPGCRMRKRRRLAPPAQAAGSSGSGGGGAGAGPSRDKYKRLRPASPSTSSSSQPSDADSGDGGEQGEEGAVDAEEEEELPQAGPPPPPQQQQVPASAAARAWPVAFGSLSVAGRSRDMEDTVSLRPGFCTWADGSPMHFFAVFDGHGGSHVAELCRDRMHEFLAEELAAEAAAFPQRLQQQQQAASAAGEGGTSSAAGADAASSSSAQQQEKEEEEEERAWRAALSRAFRRVDALASRACACGRVASPPCRCPLSGSSGIVGSTAVVAVLVRGRVVVANCGDSRAVLCRRRAPVPLSDDHKPNRPDELARIQAAGGRVVFNNGHRVRGILAMSRALGDRMLRPEVIAEPEITVTDRTPEDECLILASDGMWDAVPNEIACSVARQCLQDGNPATAPVDDAAAASGEGVAAAGPEPAERCSNAASLLVRLAFGRDSWDNISVVVIDLQRRQ